MSRKLAEARCQAKGHLLARLSVDGRGHHVLHVPRIAVADARHGRPHVSSQPGEGRVIDLDDDADPFRRDGLHPACGCGREFSLSPSQLISLAYPRQVEVVDGVRIVGDSSVHTGRPPVLRLAPEG